MHSSVTMESLATDLRHQRDDFVEMKADLKVLLKTLPTLASRDEVIEIRQAQAANAGDIRALEVRLRAVEDSRTALRAVIAFLSVLGVGGIGVLLKWLLPA